MEITADKKLKKLIVVGDRVLIKPKKDSEKTASGLFLPPGVKEKERVTYAWFAPELNYLLVKLYQVKAGTEQFEAQLSSLTLTE